MPTINLLNCRVGTWRPPYQARSNQPKTCARSAHKTAFTNPLCAAEGQAQAGGDLGEHWPSSAVRHDVCASPGRVAQPHLLAIDRGNAAGTARRGVVSLVTFFTRVKKVTGMPGHPGGFRWVSLRSTHPKLAFEAIVRHCRSPHLDDCIRCLLQFWAL